MAWKFGIVGCGSIGKRHLRNLRALGQTDLFGIDPTPSRQAEAAEIGAKPVDSLARAIEQGVNVVFITLPNHLHRAVLEESIEAGCHVFVEKPIAIESAGIAELVAQAEAKKLVGFMGSNWKFHPAFKQMKALLDAGKIGRVLSARAIAGQYLPDWHPWEDYRYGYSANRKMGGGILLDSHEINYMTWFLGGVKTVACMLDKQSDLEIDTEDTVGLLLRLQSGTLAEIHLDYNQRTYQRSYDFHGTQGYLSWDMRQRAVRLYERESDVWTVFETSHGYDLNQMYLDQTQHFLDCLDGKATPQTPLAEGLEILRIIEAAKQSSAEGRFVDPL